VPIEEAIREASPALISQAVVVGDQRKHLAALITLRTELTLPAPPAAAAPAGAMASCVSHSDFGAPSDTLEAAAQQFIATALGAPGVTSVAAAAQHPAVRAAVAAAVAAANEKSVSQASRVHKWEIVAPDFS
jgi:long-subunit acyl-CoA synthetase (AMP-forming)